jgi:hypothetical protein
MTTALPRLAIVAALGFAASACGLALRSPSIAELKSNPGRYYDRSVNIEGVVTSAWGVSFLPGKVYRVDDGTGELIVVSSRLDRPVRSGNRVRVRGKVGEMVSVNNDAYGLHLREEDLDIRRR